MMMYNIDSISLAPRVAILLTSRVNFALVVLCACSLTDLLAATPQHPNVLMVMTDDQGYGDISSHGNPHVKTPNLDRFADSGVRFERFFVSPVCAPTRASLLTGRYHLRTGVSGVTRGYENLRAEEITIAELFRDGGYSTGCFGKWHNGRHMPMHPNGQGFETFVGFCGGHWNTYFDPPLEQNGQPIQRQGAIADVITDEAITFMHHQKDKPWLCYVAYNTPHSPWRVPDQYWEKYNGLGLDTKAQCAYAMVEHLDDNFARLLKEVDRQEDTIVLFLTDNGANSARFNAGMKGRKGSIDEGGTRVPLFIRYPGVIATGKTIQPIASHLDILPTLAELCHVKIPDELQHRLDGQSLVPLISSDSKESNWPKRMLFTDAYRTSDFYPKDFSVDVDQAKKRGYRLTSFPILKTSNVHGFAAIGSIVDVLFHGVNNAGKPVVLKLLERVELVEVSNRAQGNADTEWIATLFLTPAQQKAIKVVKGRGTLSLSLRSPSLQRTRAAVRTDQYRATMQNQKWQLYDMVNDPGQTRDIAKDHQEVVLRLSTAFEKWRSTINYDSLAAVWIPVGHPERDQFSLPANEARLIPGSGEGIRYTGETASGYANSWITDWDSTNAYPTWEIDVLDAQDYRVSLKYTCHIEDVGCQLEVRIGEQSQLVNIPAGVDPPLKSKPDRLYSTNYQEKEFWATVDVGEFQLQAGKQSVMVRLRSIPGNQGIDLKSIELTRIRQLP